MNDNKRRPSSVQSAAQDRIVSPEVLSTEQRAVVDRYLKIATLPGTAPGVLVGVMRGRETWDLRPLLLDTASAKGGLSLLRVTAPELAYERRGVDAWRRLSRGLGGLRERAGVLWSGEAEGQFWIKRRFFQYTLADFLRTGAGGLPVAPIQVLQKLVGVLRFIKEEGLVHGHITADNLVVDDSQVILLDYGFSALSPRHESIEGLAPEIASGDMPSTPADVFGAGSVFNLLLGNSASNSQRELVRVMQSPDPAARPGLNEIERFFSPLHQSAGRSDSFAVPAGKVINPVRTSIPRLVTPQAERNSALDRPPPAPPVPPLQSQPPPPSPYPPQDYGTKKAPRPWLLAVLALVSCLAVLQYFGALKMFPAGGGRAEGDYRVKWQSGDHDLMNEVARDAVSGEAAAQEVIVQDALSGKERENVRSRLLKNAFNSHWKGELKTADRRLALALALSAYAIDTQDLISLDKAHPGVLVAAAGDLSLKAPVEQLNRIELTSLSSLPAPFGFAFRELGKSGVTNLGALPARALCHLLLGDASPEILEAYFGRDSSDEIFLSRFLVVLPLTDLYPPLAKLVEELIRTRGDILARRLEWFDIEKVAQWNKIPASERLLITAGIGPSGTLSFEQWADLLRFPGATVKRMAEQQLQQLIPQRRLGAMLAFLSSDKNQLNRAQVISVLFAVKLEGDEAYSLMGRWFETQPDPQSVLGILLERRDIPKLDAFNVEASRYLASRDWQASIEQLALLTRHQEPLARALAYSRLNPAKPAEAALLREATQREPSEKIKQELLRKLGHSQAEPENAEQPLPVDPGAEKLLPGGEELMVQ